MVSPGAVRTPRTPLATPLPLINFNLGLSGPHKIGKDGITADQIV